ncbi:MAG TPA: outer membrane protein assembly factor BamA, partial [Opitutales bacterium]|nr:outer membrane protein assembly factor BamA [Opitutales bacterium]
MGVVTFHVDEGTKIKIDDIVFEGNQAFKSRKLRGLMDTKRHGMFSWLTGGGKFEKDKFRESIDKLLAHYRENGFLDVVINEEDVRIEYPEERRMQIVIPVSEGKQYSLGGLSVQGNTVYTDFELLRLVRLVPDSVFSPEKVDEAASDLQKYYGSQGYLDTYVRAERVPNMSTGKIDILFRVNESDKIYVENINIQGNTTTKTIVILREMALAPGEVFDMIRMENSKLRLENTRYFEFVNLTPEETNIPGRRNLRVTVKEGRTGNFSFGAGFSSLEQASFFTEISMGNFDLFNWRSFFQGDGQKFRLRLSVGSRRNEAVLDFQEPWLFEKRLALGVQLFREETDNLISEYDIQRTGFSVSLRQRLFELVEGIYAYRWENIQYSNVSSSLTEAYGRNMFGDRDASRFSFTLLRDTRNRMVFTSRGSRVSWMNQVSGTVFGGDVDAWNSELRMAQFIPTFSTLNQSLAILGRVGTVMPLEDARYVYASDRYYLGGPEDLRGFEYREVGPKTSNGVTTGGNTYGFLSLEYQFQLSEQFQFVTFYDWGFLNPEDFDFNPANYNDNFGFGIRMLVMGAPMRLDYGIPIT